MNPTEFRGRLDGDGVQLAYVHWPGDGNPIVAIHGMTSNALFYGGVAERLDGRRPVLALDLRGRGDSDKPADGYGLDQHAADVAAAVQAFGISRAVIVGHSFGSAVATAVAARYPELCAGVVLYDGGHHAFAAALTDSEAVEEFARSSAAIDLRMHRSFASPAEYEDYWRGLSIFTDEQWGSWVDRYLDYDVAVDPETGELRAKCSPDAVQVDAKSLLAAVFAESEVQLDVPVLQLCADQGLVNDTRPIVSDAALDLMRKAFPDFHAERLPNTNHYTVALADPAASVTAEHLAAFATACSV